MIRVLPEDGTWHRVGRNMQQIFSKQYKYLIVKVKVKCTLVQALRLCTGRTAHRGSRGIALLFHDQQQ